MTVIFEVNGNHSAHHEIHHGVKTLRYLSTDKSELDVYVLKFKNGVVIERPAVVVKSIEVEE